MRLIFYTFTYSRLSQVNILNYSEISFIHQKWYHQPPLPAHIYQAFPRAYWDTGSSAEPLFSVHSLLYVAVTGLKRFPMSCTSVLVVLLQHKTRTVWHATLKVIEAANRSLFRTQGSCVNSVFYPHVFLTLSRSGKKIQSLTHSHPQERLQLTSCCFTTLILSTARCCHWQVVGFAGYIPQVVTVQSQWGQKRCNYYQQFVYDILSTFFHEHFLHVS